MRISRNHQDLEPFDDLSADLDDPEDRRSRTRIRLSLRCDVDRSSHSFGWLKAWCIILLSVSLVIGTAYAAGIDPLPIIRELLAAGLRE
jgi:hypothetical protein